jgi:Ni,Fe-hydrogenase maturation factor
MTRIICIGNRFAYPDNFGILIYEELEKLDLDDLEIVEGGVGGMSLISYFEDDAKILIVDYAVGFDKNILTQDDIKDINIDEYNHSTSFLYLLKTVSKPYTIFCQRKEFDKDNLDKYIVSILDITRSL